MEKRRGLRTLGQIILRLLGAEACQERRNESLLGTTTSLNSFPSIPQTAESPSDIPIPPENPSKVTNVVVFEMDVHWVAFAGENPVTWMEKISGYVSRYGTLKDFAADTANTGTGRARRCATWERDIRQWQRLSWLTALLSSSKMYVAQTTQWTCLKESIEWANGAIVHGISTKLYPNTT